MVLSYGVHDEEISYSCLGSAQVFPREGALIRGFSPFLTETCIPLWSAAPGDSSKMKIKTILSRVYASKSHWIRHNPYKMRITAMLGPTYTRSHLLFKLSIGVPNCWCRSFLLLCPQLPLLFVIARRLCSSDDLHADGLRRTRIEYKLILTLMCFLLSILYQMN